MSADLVDEPRPNLLIRIKVPPVASTSADAASSSEREDGDGGAADHQQPDDGEQCRTPTSRESRIPAALTCPPAPRKPKAPCKRPRTAESEHESVEKTHLDEIEEFFRRCEEEFAPTTALRAEAKRRCLSV